MATVVEHQTLPQAVFGVTDDDEPFVAFWNTSGAMNTTKHFAHDHLSPARAQRAVREAMAVHAAITTTELHRAAAYERTREVYLRKRLEAQHLADGGAQALAQGAL
jgi:signal transduction protein with GAF and PtsI domain